MRTKGLFLTGAVLLSMFTAKLSAQTYETAANLENDTIALGSKAKYKVDLYYNDVAPSALFNPSGVVWTFPTGYAGSDFTQINGTTALTTGADGAYNQQEIVMTAKTLTSGTPLVLRAQELSRPIAGVGCIDPTGTTRNIEIVAMPTATFLADSGACSLATGAADVLPIRITFSGYGRYDVSFSVQAYNMSNAAQGAPVTINLTGLYNSRVKGSQTFYVNVPTTTFPSASIPAAGGYYQVSMTNLQDRISQKTLGYTFGTTQIANATPAGNNYKFYIYPAPTTQPIQHVRNF